VRDGCYRVERNLGGKALLDMDFADFTQDADVTPNSGCDDAGPTFRAATWPRSTATAGGGTGTTTPTY
jgi:hypothetical protein